MLNSFAMSNTKSPNGIAEKSFEIQRKLDFKEEKNSEKIKI